ncbi:MAG: cyclase family protein [Anaerolineales bacterium]
MRIHDISIPISPSIPVWPGDPAVQLELVKRISAGDHANASHLACGVHTGTHVDAPFHFIDGASTVDSMPLDVLTGRALVVDLPKADQIDAAALKAARIPPRTQRVLFKTRNSKWWAAGEREFRRDFVAVTADGASWLVERGVRLVGVDYLSVAPFGNSTPTHRILLEAGVVIVEGVNLTGIRRGRYRLTCLPLKLVGSDGAPARAILVED